ncbi:hypothetical protein [Microbacterium sp. 22242]|uniref:hypothetical protein n=1 Tax=Microbacterium sp. 22242 TaxID=3453896 RepID=UPI003F879467
MPDRPEVVCICGSIRFLHEMRAAQSELTFAGIIVLAPAEAGEAVSAEQKALLDELHLRKIDMADRVLVVNPGGYIGESTRGEIAYARAAGKPVSFTGPAHRRKPLTEAVDGTNSDRSLAPMMERR